MKTREEIIEFLKHENYNLDPLKNADVAFIIALQLKLVAHETVGDWGANLAVLRSEGLIKYKVTKKDPNPMPELTPDGVDFVKQIIGTETVV